MSKRSKEFATSAENPAVEGIELSNVYLNCLVETLGELNRVDVSAEIMREYPLLTTIERENRPTVPLSLLLSAYLTAQNHVADTAFSIRMGRNLKISSHGGLSHLLISAPNLKSAIECLSPFYELRAPFLNINLEERGDRATVIIDFTSMRNTPLEQIVGGLLTGVALNVFQFYGLASSEEIEVNVNQLNQKHLDLYQELFSLTPGAGRKTFAITFPRHFLQAVSPLADRELFELALRSCQALKDTRKDTGSSLSDRIKTMIMTSPENDWSQETVAEAFYMSVSTLRRRLAREALTYKEVVTSAKMDAAKSLLLKSDRQITAVSQQLGFSDASNFASAFKRHTGLSPSEFRSRYLGSK